MRAFNLKVIFSWILSWSLILAVPAHADWNWKAELASPVTEPVARWVLIGGTGLTLFILGTDEQLAAPFEQSTVERKPLGEASKYGDLLGQLVPNVLYVGGMAMAKWAGYKNDYREVSLMVTATAYAGLVTTGLKYSVREGRPYNSRVRDSFPSGHTSTAFAFAGVVAAEHGGWYGVPAMLLATFVGYSRINDHKHYLKDVVAGATLGLSCSLGVYYSRRDDASSLSNIQIMPRPLPDGMELAGIWQF